MYIRVNQPAKALCELPREDRFTGLNMFQVHPDLITR